MEVGNGTEGEIYGFGGRERFWVRGFYYGQIHLRLVFCDHSAPLGDVDVFFLTVKVFEFLFFADEANFEVFPRLIAGLLEV